MNPSEENFWKTLAKIDDRLERRLHFVAWLTSALTPHGIRPIVVGGHALEFYTLGDYTTGDIDMVCTNLEPIQEILEKAGFKREGRHWYREDVDLAVEFPSSSLLGAWNRVEEVLLDNGTAYIIGKEDLLIDRLNACVHWHSEEDCRWAKRLLLLYGEEMDWEYLYTRAQEEGTREQLEQLWSEVQSNHDEL